MSKDPAMMLYTSDFLTGTMLMTNEQVGKYIRLLCYEHQHGRMREKDMMNMCSTYDEDIFCKFKTDDAGLYYNCRLEEEQNKRIAYSESRKANRTLKKESYDGETKNTCETYDEHMDNVIDNVNTIDSVPKVPSTKVPSTKVKKEEAEPKPYEEIIDYLNQRAGTHFSYKSPATQKLIDARLKDYTVEDFRTVIEKKCKEWLDTEMAKYIKPETLFAASHFDGYLNQLVGTGKSTYGKQPEFNMITELKKMYEEEEKKENDKTRNNGNAGCF